MNYLCSMMGLFIVYLLVLLFFTYLDKCALKSEAVKHGAAEWIVNPDNGTTTFSWKQIQ